MAHPNDPPKAEVDLEGLEDEVDDDEGEISPGATPSTSAYSSFESNKLETTVDEEIEVEKEMAEDDEDS